MSLEDRIISAADARLPWTSPLATMTLPAITRTDAADTHPSARRGLNHAQ